MKDRCMVRKRELRVVRPGGDAKPPPLKAGVELNFNFTVPVRSVTVVEQVDPLTGKTAGYFALGVSDPRPKRKQSRDEYLNDRAEHGLKWEEILRGVESAIAAGKPWKRLSSIRACQIAIREYRKKKQLPPLAKRKPGRRS